MMNLHGLLLSLFLHGALAFAVGSHLRGEDLPPSPPHAIEVVFEKPDTPSHVIKKDIKKAQPSVSSDKWIATEDSRPPRNDVSKNTVAPAEGGVDKVKATRSRRQSFTAYAERSVSVDQSRPCAPSLQRARHEGLSNPLPSYPVVARKRGHEGTVTLHLKISKEGSCVDAQIKTSSGSSYLDEAASAAVRSWRFTPALKGSTPTTDAIEVTFDFRLSGVEVS